MRGFLLDTCAISEFTKESPNLGLVTWLARTDANLVYLSALTIGELRYGISLQRERKKRERLERWLRGEVLPEFEERILSFDIGAADKWGNVRANARHAGTPAPVIDSMIAATAIHFGLAVVSRNDADFQRLNADVVNPWS